MTNLHLTRDAFHLRVVQPGDSPSTPAPAEAGGMPDEWLAAASGVAASRLDPDLRSGTWPESALDVGAAQSVVMVVELVRSADPVVTFTSLADKLAVMGYTCLVELVEADRTPTRINRPEPRQEAASWAELTALLEGEPLVVSDGLTVGVGFHGRLENEVVEQPPSDRVSLLDVKSYPSRFVGALVARRPTKEPVTAEDAEILHALVDHAVGVVAAEGLREQLETHRTRVEHLEQALGTNREIGIAIGILMANRRCSAEEAFALLRSASQNSNRKIRDIAAHLAYTGELPPHPPRRPSPSAG